METKYKIEIPKPCAENWNRMTPNSSGKFCESCQKNVIDFTHKSATEIQNYLAQQKGKSICGRFQQSQLNSITIQIPQDVLVNQVYFHNMFLLALLVTMGTSLLSCSDAEGKKQTIEKVEVIATDTLLKRQHTLGIVIMPDSIENKNSTETPPAPQKKEVIFKKPEKNPTLTGVIAVLPKDSINTSKD